MITSPLTIDTTILRTSSTLCILHVQGILDGTNYRQLITATQELYDKSHRDLIIDMAGVEKMSLAGLFALHSMAAIYNDEAPLDPEAGWQAIRTMKHGLNPCLNGRLKLSSPQPRILSQLVQAQFDAFLPIFDNLLDAIEAFGPVPLLEIVLPETAVLATQNSSNGASKQTYPVGKRPSAASPRLIPST